MKNILANFNSDKIIIPLILGLIIFPFAITMPSAIIEKMELDKVANGKITPTINEANVLSINKLSDLVKLDTNNNGKPDNEDVVFRLSSKFPTDIKSIVYIDGIDKMAFSHRCLAYQKQNGEYVIIQHPSLRGADNLEKEFAYFMSDKKVFDVVKMQKEIETHTK